MVTISKQRNFVGFFFLIASFELFLYLRYAHDKKIAISIHIVSKTQTPF